MRITIVNILFYVSGLPLGHWVAEVCRFYYDGVWCRKYRLLIYYFLLGSFAVHLNLLIFIAENDPTTVATSVLKIKTHTFVFTVRLKHV